MTHLKTTTLGLTLLLSALALQEVSASQWQTTYSTSTGQRVNARMTLDINFGRGNYVTEGGQRGWLSNVVLRPPGPGDPFGVEVVSGRWRFENGATGTFRFYVNGNRFDGTWTYGDGSPLYTWNGYRTHNGSSSGGGSNAPPVNGNINSNSSNNPSNGTGTGLGGLAGLTGGSWSSTDGQVSQCTFRNDGTMNLVTSNGLATTMRWNADGIGNRIWLTTPSGAVSPVDVRFEGRDRVRLIINGRPQTLIRR